jgi:type IV pilus assembly protein PilV
MFIATPRPTPQRNTGFTLVEILITVIVLSIGLLGLAGLQISGLRANMSSEARSKATLLANDIIERMRANPLGVQNPVAAADNQYAGINTASLACGSNPNPFCSSNSGGATLVTAPGGCTPAQMAAFDAWVWGCGLPVPSGVQRGGVQNLLLKGAATVTCNDNDASDADACSPGSSHMVTVSWDENSPTATATTSAGSSPTQTISLVVVP